MIKNLFSVFVFSMGVFFSCEQPQAVKGIVSYCENGRYQMQTLQKSDSQDILIFVLDTKTGEVTMREGYSGVWTKQGSHKDAN